MPRLFPLGLMAAILIGTSLSFAAANAQAADAKRFTLPGYHQGPLHQQTAQQAPHRKRAHAVPLHHGRKVVVPAARVRHYRSVAVVRPHGHFYSGYGHFHRDEDAYRWLAFTAITLKVLDVLNEEQQRAHEAAQVKAASAPVGETIVWEDGSASGSVTATREGHSTGGRYCREFQQEVTIGGKTERAYGTACRQPDGAWEIVSTSS